MNFGWFFGDITWIWTFNWFLNEILMIFDNSLVVFRWFDLNFVFFIEFLMKYFMNFNDFWVIVRWFDLNLDIQLILKWNIWWILMNFGWFFGDLTWIWTLNDSIIAISRPKLFFICVVVSSSWSIWMRIPFNKEIPGECNTDLCGP